MKRILTLLTVLCVLIGAVRAAEPEASLVSDNANVLSEATEEALWEINDTLEYSCGGAQLAVVSVEYCQEDCDVYASRLFNSWGVGDSEEDNGMLLLFVTREGRGWLAVGDGIRGSFTDELADRYMNRYFWDLFDAGDYDEAVLKLANALETWYLNHYEAEQAAASEREPAEEETPAVTEPRREDSYVQRYTYQIPAIPSSRPGLLGRLIGGFFKMNLILILAIIFLIVLLVNRARYRSYYRWRGVPIPRFHLWNLWTGPHRGWRAPPPGGPGPGGFGGRPGGPGPGGFGGRPGGPGPGGYGTRPGGYSGNRTSGYSGSRTSGFGGGRTSGSGGGRTSGFGGGAGRSGGGHSGGFGGGHSGGGGAGRR